MMALNQLNFHLKLKQINTNKQLWFGASRNGHCFPSLEAHISRALANIYNSSLIPFQT